MSEDNKIFEKNPKISVIMPVYNGAEWLDQSIQSVINQTYKNFELVMVNDGSKDNSLDIIKKYSKDDDRIVFFDNKNIGPGESLNFGIEKARGEYLCFIDQDDYYKENYLERMLNSITEYNTDIAMCYGRYFHTNDNKTERINYKYYEEYFYNIENIEKKRELFYQFTPQWTKILKKEFILKNHIKFPNKHNKGHDLPFTILCFWNANNISIVQEELYFHRVHNGQITSNFRPSECLVETFKDLECYWKKYIHKNKDFITKYAIECLHSVRDLREMFYANLKTFRYEPYKKFKKIFYSRKVKNQKKITRILFFKFKKKITKPLSAIIKTPEINNCGKCTYYATNLNVANPKETIIGSFCSIGGNVQLGCGNHPLNYLTTSPYLYFDNLDYKTNETNSHNEYWNYEPIEIGSDCWIGDNVFVKNGIKIGTGAVIGACSVITKDVPPYAIVAGVPAKIIRYRFDEETIKELLESKWWLWDDEVIKQIPFDDIQKALEFLRKYRKSCGDV